MEETKQWLNKLIETIINVESVQSSIFGSLGHDELIKVIL